MTMQADDLKAINDYFNRTPGKTQAAKDAKASWNAWWNDLSFLSKSLSSDTLNEAIKRRVAFNAANGDVFRQLDGTLTKEEQEYFANMPGVDVTGLSPQAAKEKVAAANAKVKVSPPATLLAVQYGSLRQGSKGNAVKKWQSILGIKEDGIYGPATAAATIKWQTEHAIKADGVVGPATWTAALGTSGKAKDAVTSLLVPIISEPAPANTAVVQNFDLNNAVASTAQIPAPKQSAASSDTQGNPTLRLGSTGEAVKRWQTILGIAQSGNFDAATKAATVAWQKKYKLVADGVVGTATWRVALALPSTPANTAVAAVTSALQNAQIQTASVLGAGLGKIPPALKWAAGTVAIGTLLTALWYNRKAPKASRSY